MFTQSVQSLVRDLLRDAFDHGHGDAIATRARVSKDVLYAWAMTGNLSHMSASEFADTAAALGFEVQS